MIQTQDLTGSKVLDWIANREKKRKEVLKKHLEGDKRTRPPKKSETDSPTKTRRGRLSVENRLSDGNQQTQERARMRALISNDGGQTK